MINRIMTGLIGYFRKILEAEIESMDKFYEQYA
jgi:hypothetical protein